MRRNQMCTLMEKEVLIEEVSGVAAFIARRVSSDTIPNEIDRCADIRAFLLRTSPENIQKDVVLDELRKLKAKFK